MPERRARLRGGGGPAVQELCHFCFFSGRRRHTRGSRDWSSDVCSSDLYATMRAKAREAAEWLAQGPMTDTNVQGIRDDLQTALDINPRDPESLLTAAAFYEKREDYASAARERAALTEVRSEEHTSELQSRLHLVC